MEFESMRAAAELELRNFQEISRSDYIPHKMKAIKMKAALEKLSDKERDILTQFFITRKCRNDTHVRRLQAKYKLTATRLYGLKNDALTKYAVYMTISTIEKCGKYEDCLNQTE